MILLWSVVFGSASCLLRYRLRQFDSSDSSNGSDSSNTSFLPPAGFGFARKYIKPPIVGREALGKVTVQLQDQSHHTVADFASCQLCGWGILGLEPPL